MNSSQLAVKTSASLTLYNNLVKDVSHGLAISGGTKTLSSDAITVAPASAEGRYVVAAQTGTTDTLSTINGGTDGDVILLRADAGDTITITEVGNIELPGGFSQVMPTDTWMAFCYDGTDWRLLVEGQDIRTIYWRIVAHNATPTTGDDKDRFYWVSEFASWILYDFDVVVDTVASAGSTTFQLYSLGDSADVLSTACTIDNNEYSSESAATPPVINASYATLASGDRFRADFDAIGTGTQGVTYVMRIRRP